MASSLIFLVTLLSPIHAQLQNDATPRRFARLSMEDGLSSNSVFCILQDRFGFMWFGTFSGLNRYDGRNFTVYKPEADNPYSLTSSVVFALLEDSRGDLWIGTDGGGLNFFDRDREEFISYRHDPGNPRSMSGDQVFALAEDRMGWIWVGTGGSGLNKYDRESDTFRTYRKGDGPGDLKSDIVRCILEDSRGELWIGTAGGGLSRYDREADAFTTYRFAAENPKSIGSDTVRALFEDAEKRLWVGTENGGLCMYDRSEGSFVRYGSREKRTVRAIAQDETGKLWVGTENSGIGIFSLREGFSGIVRETGDPRGLSGDRIRSLYVDGSGLLWIGTRDMGISIYNPRSRDFSLLATRNTARQILEDSEGFLWYGTDGGGLHRIDPERGAVSTFLAAEGSSAGLSSDLVYSLAEDADGNLWIGTDGGGLNRREKKSGRFRRFLHDPGDPDSLGSNVVWALLRDSKDVLWVGTEGGGLNRYHPETGGFRRYLHDPKNPNSLNGNSVRAIAEDSGGNLWVGTWDGGLSMYRPETDDFVQFKRIPGDPASLGDNSVNCIFEDRDGVLWVGTGGGGISRQYGHTGKFSHVSRKDGLSGDNVFGILQDREGHIWISTENGLSRYDPHAGSFLNFGEADGLQKNEFSQNAYGKSRDGTLFFGGPAGYSYFNPERLRGNPNVPPVLITEANLLDVPIPVGITIHGRTLLRAPISMTDTLELSWRDSVVSFTFAVLDYTDPSRNRFAMKIEGLQQEWTDLGTRHDAVVTSLRPGRYVLRVKGSNNNGVWNDAGTSLEILVYPPFWETWKFRTAFAAILGTAFVFIYKRRTLNLKKRASQLRNLSIHIQKAREEERKAASREVHDELGQYLAVLKMDLFWIRGHLPEVSGILREKIGEMIEVLNRAMDAVKSISTKLRPKVLDNLAFADALRWQIGEFERHSGIVCGVSIESDETLLDADAATGMFRIFQEILTNVLKHAAATAVELRLYRDGPCVVLEVSDNGRGIRSGELDGAESFGIMGMRERAAYLGGTVDFQGVGEKGTRVRVAVPVHGAGKC